VEARTLAQERSRHRTADGRATGHDRGHGCRAGWIAVLARQDDPDGRVRTGLRLVRQQDGGSVALIGECEAMGQRPIIAVDVPIGLPTTGGLRVCDCQPRERFGRQWICVFPAPDRKLSGRSFEQAREVVLARRAGATVNEHPIMTRRRSRSAR
jgi:predicted RNase H-like nuclease